MLQKFFQNRLVNFIGRTFFILPLLLHSSTCIVIQVWGKATSFTMSFKLGVNNG